MLKRLFALFFAASLASLLSACNTNGGIPASPRDPEPGQATPDVQPTPDGNPKPPNTADGLKNRPLHLHRSGHHIAFPRAR